MHATNAILHATNAINAISHAIKLSGGMKRILLMKYRMPSWVMPSHPEPGGEATAAGWERPHRAPGTAPAGGVRAPILRRRRRWRRMQMRRWWGDGGRPTEEGGHHRRNDDAPVEGAVVLSGGQSRACIDFGHRHGRLRH